MSFDVKNIKSETDLVDVKVYPQIGSTNNCAVKLLETGKLYAPGAILTSLQTSGRGQGTNTWHADSGSLTATISLKKGTGVVSGIQTIPLRAGLAVRTALSPYLPIQNTKIKWPNDVIVNERKIAGILCKQVREVVLIGIGINISTSFISATESIQNSAISLSDLTNNLPTRCDFFIDLYNTLMKVLNSTNWLEQFHDCDYLKGKVISINSGENIITGRYLGIDDQGRLLIDDTQKQHKILTGSIMRKTLS